MDINKAYYPIDLDFDHSPYRTIIILDEHQNRQLNLQPCPCDHVRINFNTLPGLEVTYIFHRGNANLDTTNWERYMPYNGPSIEVPMMHISSAGEDKE